jgi:hypothetical protein
MALFKFIHRLSVARPISAKEADKTCRATDAGTAPFNGADFVVEANTQKEAICGALRWLACWGDETENNVPDDLFLQERFYDKRSARSYMILVVS